MAVPDDLRAALEGLSSPISRAMVEWRLRFLEEARPKQIIEFPPGISTILCHPGRGWGKNFTGVNWICWELARRSMFGHIVAPTHNDVRFTCFEGESGIMRWVPSVLVRTYNASDLVLELYNGSILRGFGAEKPERLRGPQCHLLWSDELAAWLRMRETYDQALLGCRLGERSLHLITSTPQPKPLIKQLINDPRVLKISGHQSENARNLSKDYLERNARLKDTRLGRQELAGDLIDAEELGVVKRSQWNAWSHTKPLPAFELILMSLDTAMSEDNVDVKHQTTDYTACTVWGAWREPVKDKHGHLVEGSKPAPKILLLDAWQERLDFPQLVAKVKQEKENRYGNESTVFAPVLGNYQLTDQGRKADLILIEDKNSGTSLRQQLRADGIPVMPYDPADQNKYLRLQLASTLFVAGYIYAVTSAVREGEFKSWAEDVVAQVCSYSGEGSLEHDDLMDAATSALLWLMRNWLRQEPPVYTRRGIIRTPAGQNPYAS